MLTEGVGLGPAEVGLRGLSLGRVMQLCFVYFVVLLVYFVFQSGLLQEVQYRPWPFTMCRVFAYKRRRNVAFFFMQKVLKT